MECTTEDVTITIIPQIVQKSAGFVVSPAYCMEGERQDASRLALDTLERSEDALTTLRSVL